MATAPRSLLAFWIGGASKPAASHVALRGMMAFWAGGGSQGSGTPPVADVSEWLIRARRRKRR